MENERGLLIEIENINEDLKNNASVERADENEQELMQKGEIEPSGVFQER